MQVKRYEFPTQEARICEIEAEYCKLLSMYRSGEKLDDEQKDWMDTANNWLQTADR